MIILNLIGTIKVELINLICEVQEHFLHYTSISYNLALGSTTKNR